MPFVSTMMLVQKSLVEFTLETSKSYIASDHSFILWVFVMVPGTGVLQLCVQLPFLSAGLWSNFRIHLCWLSHICKLVVIIYKIGKCTNLLITDSLSSILVLSSFFSEQLLVLLMIDEFLAWTPTLGVLATYLCSMFVLVSFLTAFDVPIT